ncbi:hypothetical protein [Paenisporosarcina sp. TG20]|uniref:hypothetical protein n=1 Tax=Paenisporosarcina sp. TG20 TaxID=1211706 RepID=UPI0003105777|nr:hypothetical protein [Paenisporosarcina sp. TG20]
MSKNSRIEEEVSKVAESFLEQPHLRLLGRENCVYPLQLVEVEMKTVVRSQMDVLMKMILKILELLEVKQASEISELLAVEVIFVEHMLELMKKNKMIKRIETTYRLTSSGLEQLKQGTFAHDLMEEQVKLSYSPYHKEVMKREYGQNVLDEDNEILDIPFDNQSDIMELHDSHVRQLIEDSGYEFLVENGQKLIEEIDSIEVKETLRVVCFEFHLHDQTEDTVFIRVWNTWTGQFDVKFEDELNQKKARKLREKYLK